MIAINEQEFTLVLEESYSKMLIVRNELRHSQFGRSNFLDERIVTLFLLLRRLFIFNYFVNVSIERETISLL